MPTESEIAKNQKKVKTGFIVSIVVFLLSIGFKSIFIGVISFIGVIGFGFLMLVIKMSEKGKAVSRIETTYVSRNSHLDNDDQLTKSVHVVGVTFKNDDGTSRQALLKKIANGTGGFEDPDITFEQYDFQGNPAIGVYVNGKQIGNVPKENVNRVSSYIDDIDEADIEVFGG